MYGLEALSMLVLNPASRGNPGEISATFCLRDAIGDLIYVEAKRLRVTNNIYTKAIAIQ